MKVNCALIANVLPGKYYENINTAQGRPVADSFYKPLFLEFNKIELGAFIAIDCFPEDCLNKFGIIKARKQFLQALKFAVEDLGAKIVLLAASTKRLFGKEIELKVNWSGMLDNSGFTLHELYPDILFTNGDNGTAVILNFEIDKILEKAEIITNNNIIVINGLGLLGLDSLQYLIDKNIPDEQIVVVSNHSNNLKDIIGIKNIQIFTNIDKINIKNSNKIRAIINCTHNPTSIITATNLAVIQNGQIIHVIDVAVPYGFSETELKKCSNIIRQDGGNAYFESGLEFYYNPELCGLTEKVLYGCFAEAVALSAYVEDIDYRFNCVKGFDFFNVNIKTKEFVKALFKKYNISIAPVAYNFNKKINE